MQRAPAGENVRLVALPPVNMYAHMLLGVLFAFPGVLSQSTATPSIVPFTIPSTNDDVAARELQIEQTRAAFLYGHSPLGNVSFYPSGSLGNAVVARDTAAFFQEASSYAPLLQIDARAATAAVLAVCRNFFASEIIILIMNSMAV